MLIPHLVGPQDKKDLGGVFVAVSVRLFAVSLFGIFVPIYLYKSHIGLTMIFLMYAVDFTLRALIQPAISHFIYRYGAKQAFLLSNLTLIGFLGTILFAAGHPVILVCAFIFQMLSFALYFPAYFMVFIHAQRSSLRSQEIGHLQQITLVALTIGPLVGGIMLATVGAGPLMVFAAVLLVVSLRLLKDTHIVTKLHPPKSVEQTTFMWKDAVTAVGKALDNQAAAMIWPIALYFVFTNYTKVGFLIAVSLASSLLLVRLAAALSAHGHRKGLLWYSSVANAVIHLGRIGVSTLSFAFVLNLADGLANVVGLVPSQSVMFDRADGHPLNYFKRFIYTSNLTTGLFWVILAAVLHLYGFNAMLAVAFIAGATGALAAPTFIYAPLDEPKA